MTAHKRLIRDYYGSAQISSIERAPDLGENQYRVHGKDGDGEFDSVVLILGDNVIVAPKD